MFQRPRHNAILAALRDFDGALLTDAECYFGGGTAIVMALGEYRESVDIDFLCASQPGFRRLREAIWGTGFAGLMRAGAATRPLREPRTDQYGIRCALLSGDTAIKVEIVREGRVSLSGAVVDAYGVPVLDRADMYAEKLMANDDRWADRAAMSRDIIDLSMMISRWGAVPNAAWRKAEDAYGHRVRASFDAAAAHIKEPDVLRGCMAAMAMDPALAAEILAVHR